MREEKNAILIDIERRNKAKTRGGERIKGRHNTVYANPEEIISIQTKGEFGQRKGSLKPLLAMSSEANTREGTYSYHKSRAGISINSPILSMNHYPQHVLDRVLKVEQSPR